MSTETYLRQFFTTKYGHGLYLQWSVDSDNLIIIVRIKENIVNKLLSCCSRHNSATWLSMQSIIPVKQHKHKEHFTRNI